MKIAERSRVLQNYVRQPVGPHIEGGSVARPSSTQAFAAIAALRNDASESERGFESRTGTLLAMEGCFQVNVEAVRRIERDDSSGGITGSLGRSCAEPVQAIRALHSCIAYRTTATALILARSVSEGITCGILAYASG